MEGQLLSSVEDRRLTRIPGVMWEVASRFKWGPPRIGAAASGCNCHAGDQPGSGTRVYSQLPAGGSRLGFKSGLVGLGKDASAPTSTDRIASHQRTRFPKMAQMRRQEKTLGNGTSRLPSAPAPTTRTRHSSPAHRPDALEITTPQARGRSAEQSSPTPRRSSGSAGGRSAGGAPSGGRLSREGLWTVSLRAPFIKGAPLATRGPEFYARSSPRGGSSHFPSDSPINPGRHGEAAPTQIQSVHPHSRTGRQLRAPAEPGHSRIATRARVLLASRRSTRSAFCGPVISGPGQHQDQIDSDLGGSHTVGQVPQAQALSRAGVQDTFSPPISRQCQGRRARSVSQKDPAGRYSFDPKRKPCILWIS